MAKNKKKLQGVRSQDSSVQNSKNKNTESLKLNPVSSKTLNSESIFQNPNILIAILSVAVITAFFGGFFNDFVIWDDPAYASENKLIQTPTFANLIRLLGVECALNYHPFTMATLWLNSYLFGKGPTSFIITNALIHLVNTLLVFKFAQKLSKNNLFVAFFTALLWGIHPMHTESVTWVAERKDVLYVCFFLLSCLQYIRFLETENRRFLIYSLLLFVVSCLAKGMAVVLPLVLMLIDYWWEKDWLSPKNLIQKIPFFIVALLFGALAVHVQGGGNLGGRLEKMSLDTAISSVFTFGQKLTFGFYGFLVYIFKLFLPINQHNFYAYPSPNHYSDVQYITSPIWALLILGGAVFAYRRKKEVFFGILFFFVTIVLVLQFLSVGGAILAERYTYLPYFGLIFGLIFWLNSRFSEKTLTVVFSVVALIFIFLTYQQTKTYKNTATLFENSYKYEPESSVVAENLANFYGKSGNYKKTLMYGEIALSKNVASYGLFGALGNAYYLDGDYKKSADFFEKALPLTPIYRRSSVYYNRGIMNRAAGNYQQAADDFDQAMKLDTSAVRLYLGQRAYSLLLAKDWQKSAADYTKMINMKIAADTAYNNRAVDRFNLGDRDGAIQDLQNVMKINPNYTDARNNLVKLGVLK